MRISDATTGSVFRNRLKLAYTVCALSLAIAFCQTASAADIIYGSGMNADLSTTFQRDSNWNIVATPTTTTIGLSTVPYQAYVPRTVPGAFYGGNSGPNGSQGGYTVDSNTFYWISPSSTDASIANGSYNWIAAQTFEITSAGEYEFNFYAAGDNAIEFFVDGSIDQTNAQQPVITGGTQIGGYNDGFTVIYQYTGSMYLSAGTHTAYMVLYDFGGNTAALIGQSTFASVPEPSTYALGMISTGFLGLIARRRKARRTRD
jgi:hypothetical protein